MISLTMHFVCDRCGKEEQGHTVRSEWHRMPSPHLCKPAGWMRTYGYDLCIACAEERKVRERVNNLFNSTLHAMKDKTGIPHIEGWKALWEECRMRTYVDIREYVNELRKRKESK